MDMTTTHHRIGYSTSIATTLLLAALLQTANSHALPRPTPTVALREFSVESWPRAPTNAPQVPNDLLRRQFNTICGYIGGDLDLPATCSAGSHCAADSQNGVIGCCPDEGPCTQGIFTGCIDRNSDPQTEINPYVFTCSGSDVCYQNKFDEGLFQYGCGSASSLANTVATAVSGVGGLNIASVSVDLTASATSLSEPTTIGTSTRARTADTSTESSTSATLSSSSSSSSSSSESSTSGETTVSSETSATESSSSADASSTSSGDTAAGGATAPNRDDDEGTNVGAIVGGSVGGVAAVAMLLTVAIWLWKRKSRNSRQGPGMNQSTEYITSVVHAHKSQDESHADTSGHSPMTDNRQQFSQLPTTWEEPEPEIPPHMPKAYGGIGSSAAAGGIAQHYDSNSSGSMRGAAVGGSQPYEPDREPLTGELDDFSRGFNTAIDDIDGNDETQPNGQGMGAYTRSRGDGGRPLWQQNRRRSRNMMWM